MSQFAEVFSTMFANDTENHSIYKKMVGLFLLQRVYIQQKSTVKGYVGILELAI